MWPLTSGANAPTTSRIADGKTLTPRTISMSSVRPMHRTRGLVRPHAARARPDADVVARAEAKERRGAMPQVREDELAGRAVVQLDGGAGLGVDQLDVDEAAGSEMHAVLLLALAKERGADVTDAHRLGHPRAPGLLEPRAEVRLAAAGLARDEHALDARAAKIERRVRRPFDRVRGVGGSQHRRLRPEQLDRPHQPLGVAGADRDVSQAEPVEGGKRCPATNGPAL